MKLVFDLETDGLLDEVTKIHCMVTREVESGEIRRYKGDELAEGLHELQKAEQIIGHNIIGYDLPVLRKLYDITIPVERVFDTLVVSRLLNTELKRFDYKRTKHNFPSNLLGKHSLEAWGHRLGEYKGHKPESWEVYTPEMLEYCEQDVKVTKVLYQKFLGQMWKGECVRLEHEVASVIHMQEQAGIHFDVKKAGVFLADLHAERQIVELVLKDKFKGWYKLKKEFTPKVNSKKFGYTKGCPLSLIEWIEFNPNSRPHLVHVLKDKYGWKPTKISNAGNALMDESVLKGLSKMGGTTDMLSYLTISKRISQLSEGKSAWLKHVTKEGTIHGRVNPMGTITGRMSHYSPNMSQVPAVYSPYGKECRELFTVRSPNNFIVGADADGLELRCLAHYLWKYDGGKYARAVLYGNKEEGTDAHSLTLKALGSLCTGRDVAKTFFYALLYGAGDYKLGLILGETQPRRASAKGKLARAKVGVGITGLKKLQDRIAKGIGTRQKKYKRQWLNGIDGRKIFVRSEHAALNSLLQSAGGVLMKKALVLLYNQLEKTGLHHGVDYWFIINSHDEWQIEVKSYVDKDAVGRMMCNAMRDAGHHFNFNVPTTGEYKIGKDWSETH
jgi:DNA polymerase-1